MNILNFFNKNFKLVMLIAIAVLIFLFVRQLNRNNDLARENQQLKQTESILSNNLIAVNDTMEFWKDKADNSLSEVKVLTATNEMLDNQYSEINKKYRNLLGDNAKANEMIAYLNSQIEIKDQIIEELSKNNNGGSYILNDSTIAINVGKEYDSLNYYNVNGTVLTRLKDNKIVAGTVDLTTTVGLRIEFGISQEKKTSIASITSKTAFPAKVSFSGITRIEKELNKKPSAYMGLAFTLGYGSTLQQQPQLAPFLGVGVYYAPRWLSFKIRNR